MLNKILLLSTLLISNLNSYFTNNYNNNNDKKQVIPVEHNISHFKQFFSLLTPYNINNYTKIRVGNDHDGGYIIPKELISVLERCYTYGAGDNITFELDLKKLNNNMKIIIYDHTVDYPEIIESNIFFKKEGIAPVKSDLLNTLANHINENNDQNKKILLKMDIEGSEWDIIDKLEEFLLKNVVMVAIELHWFIDQPESTLNLYKRVLEKLNNQFSVFHVHANNNADYLYINGKLFPNVIEITYINNNYVNSKEILRYPLIETYYQANCITCEFHNLDFWLN